MTHLRQAMLEELQRRNYAKTTVYYYLKAVERFAAFFHTSPDQLNQSHLRRYQAYLLRERKLGPRTVKLHVSALRFFFVKTLKRTYLLDDIPYPKVPRRLPTVLTVDEVTRLIDAARTLTDRTMLMVLYSTGMRNAEMRSLQVKDIDSRAMLIHIQRGKGGRDRYVPLSPTLLETLRVYWRWMKRKTWLFPGTIAGWRADKPIRTLTLDADEFLRRFLLHVLPKRFVRIRYFGFLAPRCRTRELAHCRHALAVTPPPPHEPLVASPPRPSWPCPRCGAPMRIVERLTARQLFLDALLADVLPDTS